MKEVDGPLITVTKKTSITKLDNMPTIVDNNLREVFAQTPGLYYSEQQSPGQLNLSYRGIGNPQESEFVTVMLDGIPLEGDWVGFPTIYTFPLPQTLSEVQLIRGGSSLLYGPEPPPVVNMISRKPNSPIASSPATPRTSSAATACSARSTSCPARRAVGLPHRRALPQGRRRARQRRFDASRVATSMSAIARAMTRTPTLDHPRVHAQHRRSRQAEHPAVRCEQRADHDAVQPAVDRPLRREPDARSETDADSEIIAKLWSGYQDQASRSQDRGNPPTTSTLQDEQFRFTGPRRALRRSLGPRQRVHGRRRLLPLRCAVPSVGRGQSVPGSLRPLRRSVRVGDADVAARSSASSARPTTARSSPRTCSASKAAGTSCRRCASRRKTSTSTRRSTRRARRRR